MTALVALAALAGGWSGRVSAPPAVHSTQKLVALLAAHEVRAAPTEHAARLSLIAAQRPITGVRTVLPVLGRTAGGWLRVRLPGRPNGATGWISARATRAAITRWHLVVDRARRQALAYRSGRLVRAFRAVVGKPSTPTPAGTFFVEEAVRLAPGDPGAPFALALSARSNVLQEFDGGPGQIALHGLRNIGGVPGTAVSHGCVRLTDDAITWLAARIGAGVPVTILG